MLYNKVFACDYDELITYYPLFYRDVLEMDAILRAHGKLADDLEDNIERVFANNFIDTADEATIERLERFLDIGLNRSRTLEERRRLVKSFFAGFGKVSASMLAGIIESYTGAKVTARFEPCDEAGNNMLYLEFERGDVETLYMSDVNLLIDKKIPAHIQWRAAVVYTYGVAVGFRRTHYLYDHELSGTKPDFANDGYAYLAVAVIEAKKKKYLVPLESASESVQAGTLPETSTEGSYRAVAAVIGSKAEFYTTDYKKAQNGDLEAGTWPEVQAEGISREIGAGTEFRATPYNVDYIYCGTRYAQS